MCEETPENDDDVTFFRKGFNLGIEPDFELPSFFSKMPLIKQINANLWMV